MATPRRLVLATALLTGIVACNGSSDESGFVPPPSGSAGFRVVNASPDSPTVDVADDNTGQFLFTGLGPDASSQLATFTPNPNVAVRVQTTLPDGNVQVALQPTTVSLFADTDTSLFLLDNFGALSTLIVDVQRSTIPSGAFRLTVVHAGPSAGTLDVHLTGQSDPLTTPLASLSYRAFTNPLTVTNGGGFRLRLTQPGTQNVVFDTGSFPSQALNFASNQRYLLVLVNSGVESAPARVLIVEDQTATELRDVNGEAQLRVVHSAPDAGDAEVWAQSVNAQINPPQEIFPNVSFGGASPSFTSFNTYTAAADYTLIFSAEGTGPGTEIVSGPAQLLVGNRYTLVASGLTQLPGSMQSPAFLLLLQEARAAATEARLGVVHMAPSTAEVDVYLSIAGTIDTNTILNGGVTPQLSNFPLGQASNVGAFSPGNYDLRVVTSQTNVLLVDQTGVSFPAGTVANLILRGPDQLDGAPSGYELLITR